MALEDEVGQLEREKPILQLEAIIASKLKTNFDLDVICTTQINTF